MLAEENDEIPMLSAALVDIVVSICRELYDRDILVALDHKSTILDRHYRLVPGPPVASCQEKTWQQSGER